MDAAGSVDKADAQGMATELLAETAWRQMFASLDGFSGAGLQGQVQSDWLAQTLASELAGPTPTGQEVNRGS